MHKTGGVTTKVELMYIVNRAENVRQLTKRGQRLRYAETCYKKQIINPNDKSIENMWRCDFGQLKQFPEQNLSAIDIVMGHQYWNSGCDFLFAKHRDVRYFSIFRHPLPRKLSFFYHFFVRNMGKDEAHVGKEEVISFLLGDSLPNDSRVRDAGPNYYASRMLSDGVEGFVKHRYTIKKSDEGTAIRSVKYKLDNRYVFVGLQMQTAASQCMLQKTVQLLAHAHGIDEMVGTPKLSESKQRLNAGGYSWTAEKVWHAMTSEQKLRYKEVESVDLAIYKEVVDKFKKDVKLFSCEHRVDEQTWLEDIFE